MAYYELYYLTISAHQNSHFRSLSARDVSQDGALSFLEVFTLYKQLNLLSEGCGETYSH